jgi:hypothetical protein
MAQVSWREYSSNVQKKCYSEHAKFAKLERLCHSGLVLKNQVELKQNNKK